MPRELPSSPFPYFYLLAPFRSGWTNCLCSLCSCVVCLDGGWQLKWFSFYYSIKTFLFFPFSLQGIIDLVISYYIFWLKKPNLTQIPLPSPWTHTQTNICRPYTSSGSHKIRQSTIKLPNVNLAPRKGNRRFARGIFCREDPSGFCCCALTVLSPLFYPQKIRQDRLVTFNIWFLYYCRKLFLLCMQVSQMQNFFPCLNHTVSSAPFLLSQPQSTLPHAFNFSSFLALNFPLHKRGRP